VTTLAYYPGCSLHGTSAELDRSFRASMQALDIELAEIPGWECCGNTAAHSASRLLAIALPANELVKVGRDMGLDSVAVPCAACFSRFMAAEHELAADEQVRREVELVVGRNVPTGIKILNLVDVYHDAVGLQRFKAKVTRPLGGLKVAAYYGCLLTRPPKVTLAEDPECPTRMDDVLRALGAAPVQWSYKTDCCGASLALCEQSIVIELVRRIVADARACGAEAIVAACPLCQINLDSRQLDIKAKDPAWQPLPVVFLSQLVGHAVGVPAGQLGWNKHLTAVPSLS
jgi:heterodisulfide reductase subunit B